METNEKLIEQKTFEIEVLIDLETETVRSSLMKTIQQFNHQRSDDAGREWVLLSWSVTNCEIVDVRPFKDKKKEIQLTITITMRNKCFFEGD